MTDIYPILKRINKKPNDDWKVWVFFILSLTGLVALYLSL